MYCFVPESEHYMPAYEIQNNDFRSSGTNVATLEYLRLGSKICGYVQKSVVMLKNCGYVQTFVVMFKNLWLCSKICGYVQKSVVMFKNLWLC